MRVKFACAVSIAAAVAMLTACSKKNEGEADKSASAAVAVSAASASEVTVVKIGHAAPLTGGIAHLGKDNENGARLAISASTPSPPVQSTRRAITRSRRRIPT